MSAFSPPFALSSPAILVEVNSSVTNFNLFIQAGSPIVPVIVYFNVKSAARIRNLDMRGFLANSIVFMTVDGHVWGFGGDGGNGELEDPETPLFIAATPGTAGGDAIKMNGNLEVFLQVNASGKIYGGGGGEGGFGVDGGGSVARGKGGGGGVENGNGGVGNPAGANATGVGVDAIPGGGGGTWGAVGLSHITGIGGAAGGAGGKAISKSGANLHLTNNGDIRGAVS